MTSRTRLMSAHTTIQAAGDIRTVPEDRTRPCQGYVSGSTCVEHDGDMNPLSGAARRRHWLTSIKWHLDDCFRPRTLMRGWIAFVHAVPVECERVGYGTAWQGCANVTEARGCGRSGRPFATGRHLPHLKTIDPRVARGSCTAENARCGQSADTPGDAQGCGVLLHDPGTGAALRHHPRANGASTSCARIQLTTT